MSPMFSLFISECVFVYICLSLANLLICLFMAGIESAKSENYEQAFSCFLTAAEQGYNKAQFNVGVCYEKGRGVSKDREKVSIQAVHLILLSFSSFLKS